MELCEAILKAVTMTPEMRKSNHEKLYNYVTKYTATRWGLTFKAELEVFFSSIRE